MVCLDGLENPSRCFNWRTLALNTHFTFIRPDDEMWSLYDTFSISTGLCFFSSFQTDDRHCRVCQVISSADLHHPPVLPSQRNRPVRLHGNWVSTRCEVRPGILFLTRYLTFHEESGTWEGQYEHFSDPVCRRPTFSITASGHYSRGGPSSTVTGGVEFTFTGTHAIL